MTDVFNNYLKILHQAFTKRNGVILGDNLDKINDQYCALNNQANAFLNTNLNSTFCNIIFISNYYNNYDFWGNVNTKHKCLILMNLDLIIKNLNSNGVKCVELGVESYYDQYEIPKNVFYYHTDSECFFSYDFNIPFDKLKKIDGRNINSKYIEQTINDEEITHHLPDEIEFDKVQNICYYSASDFNFS